MCTISKNDTDVAHYNYDTWRDFDNFLQICYQENEQLKFALLFHLI